MLSFASLSWGSWPRNYFSGPLAILLITGQHAICLESSFGSRMIDVDRSATVSCNVLIYLGSEEFERPSFSRLKFGQHIGEMVGLPKEGEVTTQP